MRFLITMPMFLVLACGPQSQSTRPAQETYESCLAQNKMFVHGSCQDGAGLKDADLRTMLFVDVPFLETLHKNEVEICILTESTYDAMRPELERQIRHSILAWVEPLRQVSEHMPQKVRFVHPAFTESLIDPTQPLAKLCPSTSDGTLVYVGDMSRFNTDPEDRAFAKYNRKEVWMSPHNMRRGTMLHEYGHIFGLDDLYVEDEWNCRKDFPNSVMCQVEWDSLQPTDRVAVQRSYCLQTDGVHPACFNHEQKELLSFLPTKRSSLFYEGYTFRDPYILCENDSQRFSFQAFSFAMGEHFLGLFASDQTAVKESMQSNGFLDEFTVERIEGRVRGLKPIQLQMELRDEKIHVRFPVEGVVQEQTFASCYINPRLQTYFAAHDVQIPAALLSQQRYLFLNSQPAAVHFNGEFPAADPVFGSVPQSPAPSAEILIFDGVGREQLKSVPFYEVAELVENRGQGFVWKFTPAALDLAAGAYELFVVQDDNVYEHFYFKVSR